MLWKASGSRVTVSWAVIYGCQLGVGADAGIFAARWLSAGQMDHSVPRSTGLVPTTGHSSGTASRGQPRDSGDSSGHGAKGQQQPREQSRCRAWAPFLGHHLDLVFPGLFLPQQGSPCLPGWSPASAPAQRFQARAPNGSSCCACHRGSAAPARPAAALRPGLAACPGAGVVRQSPRPRWQGAEDRGQRLSWLWA